MKMLAKALVATATALTASVAFAFPVNLTSVSGSFENAVGGSNVNGEGTSQIRWGYSSGAGQSGYNFNGTSPLPQTILDSDAFVLGSLTHINKPVTGDALPEWTWRSILALTGLVITAVHLARSSLPTTKRPTQRQKSQGSGALEFPFLVSVLANGKTSFRIPETWTIRSGFSMNT